MTIQLYKILDLANSVALAAADVLECNCGGSLPVWDCDGTCTHAEAERLSTTLAGTHNLDMAMALQEQLTARYPQDGAWPLDVCLSIVEAAFPVDEPEEE